jgi:hypothetical protein
MLISIRGREMAWGDIFENGVPDMQTEGKDEFLPPTSTTRTKMVNTINSALPGSSSYTK